MVLGNLPAGLNVFLLAYKVEDKSPRTLEWVGEAVTDFLAFLEKGGPPPGDPTGQAPPRPSLPGPESIRVFGKGAKEREVYPGKTTNQAFLCYMALRKPEPEALWLSEERRPLTRRGIQQILYVPGKSSGVTGVRVAPTPSR